MNWRLLAILVSVVLSLSEPVVLITKQQHEPVMNSQQLLNYISQHQQFQLILLQRQEDSTQQLKNILRQANISKNQISSFFTSEYNASELYNRLSTRSNSSIKIQETSDLRSILSSKSKDVVIMTQQSLHPSRIMQATVQNSSVESKIFNAMSTYSLSGLWVAVFLLVMMSISLSCLFDLKTNDRFARQNLWVGRES